MSVTARNWRQTHFVLFMLGCLAVAMASAGPATAENEPPPVSKPQGWAKFGSWLNDAQIFTRINADPVKRAVACRVPYFNFTPKAMMRATHLSQSRLMKAVHQLESMGLVRIVVENGHEQVTVASESARSKLREWANQWCATDDTCEVSR